MHGIVNSILPEIKTAKICRESKFDESSLHTFAVVQDGTALLMLAAAKCALC